MIFTTEYIARLVVRGKAVLATRAAPSASSISLAVLPTWAALFVPGLHVLIDVRLLRLLRLFRIFKLAEYVEEFGALGTAR